MGSWINKDIHQGAGQDNETFSEKFSLGSLLYIRLRRVTSRVIDVMYLSENDAYADYVVNLALATDDEELRRLALRIKELLPKDMGQIEVEANSMENAPEQYRAQSAKEELIRQQLAQRYIGALR